MTSSSICPSTACPSTDSKSQLQIDPTQLDYSALCSVKAHSGSSAEILNSKIATMVRQSTTVPHRNTHNNQVHQVHQPGLELLKPEYMKDHQRYELRYEHCTGTAPAYQYYNRSIYLPSVKDPTHYELILELTDQLENQLNTGVLQTSMEHNDTSISATAFTPPH